MEDKTKKYSLNFNSLSSVVFTIGTFFGSQFVGSVLFLIPVLILGLDAKATYETAIGRTIATVLISATAVYFTYLILMYKGNSLEDIGFKNYKLDALLKSLMAYVLYFLTLLVALSVLQYFLPGLDLKQQQQIGFSSSDNKILLLISLIIVVPIAEEVVMRGLLFTGLRSGLNFYVATIITSIFFAAAHLPAGAEGLHWPAAIDTFILSLFLCYLRENTNSLLAPIALHAMKNSLALLYFTGVLA